MNRKYAIVALILGPPLILALIVAVLVALTFHFAENLNDYRGSVAAGASEALGRPVEIGAASLQLRPLLDLSLEDVTIGNLPGRPAEPAFLHFQRFRAALDPVSLFEKAPRIEHLELNGLRLNLVRDRGVLEAELAAPPAPTPSLPTTLPPVVLASANITDARILLHDRGNDRQLLIEELTAQLDGDGKLQGGMRLRATPPGLEGRLKLQGTLAYDEDSAALQPLRLDLELAGDTLPGGRGQLQLDTGLLFSLDDGTLRIEPSRLRGLGLQIQGQGRIAPAAAQAQLEAQGENLPRLLRILGLELDAPGRKEDLSFRLHAPELRLEEDKAIARKLELELLGASLRADLEGSALGGGTRPRWQGQFQGGGPDLPRLLKLYSLLYGDPQSPLARIADAYAAEKNRSFELAGRFALDGADDRFEVPELSARTLGMELAGHLNQEGDKSLQGELRLDADQNISRLLHALGQERWSGRVRSLQLRADIAGAPSRPRLAPLRLLLQLTGDEQPLELQGQAWWERSGKPPRAGLEELSVSGPGLQLAGGARLQWAPLGVEARLRAPTIEPRRLLPLLLDRMPATADPKALSRAGFDAELRLDSGQWRLDLKEMHVDEAELRGEFLFAPGAPAADARARATLQLEAGRLNLDRYLPPPAAAAAEAQDKTGDKAPAAADSAAWIAPLRNLEIEGKAAIEELILRRLRLQKIVLGLQREGETIRVSPLSASGYGGQLAARGELDLGGERPRYSLGGEGTAIDLGAVLRDLAGRSRLEGTLGLEWQLAGQGFSGDELRRGLGGSASLRLRDGTYRGIDIMKKIEVWRALTDRRPGEHSHRDDAEARTELAMLDATLQIGEGVIRNDDLSASAPRLRITGKGNYQLEQNLLDYRVTAALDNGLTIPIRISGRPPQLSYVPELGALLKQSILGKIEEKLLPGTADTAGEGEAAGEKETREQKERPKDLEDDLKDALRDLLPF